MKQYNHHSYFKGKRSQICYTSKFAAHVGHRINGVMCEVYRVQYHPELGYVAVSDMLDEGHFLQPTVEKKVSKLPRLTIEALARKYEAQVREQLT